MGIRIREINRFITNGKGSIHSFLRVTPKQLLHYMDVNLESNVDTIIMHIGAIDILEDSTLGKATYCIKNVQLMAQKFRAFGTGVVLLAGEFNAEEAYSSFSGFLGNYNSMNAVKDKICFKNPKNQKCINLLITNSSGSVQNTSAVVNHLSNVHEVIITACKYYFQKFKPKEIDYSNYKNFDVSTFKISLRLKVQNIKNYQPFEQVFLEILSEYSTLKKNFLRASHVRYETKLLRKSSMPFTELESILKTGPLKTKLNVRNQIIFIKDLMKKNENFFSLI